MKKVKLYALVISLYMVTILPAPGQENILYFMGNTPQANQLNPAQYTDSSTVVINLPLFAGLDLTLNNSFSFNDFATINDTILTINLDDFYSKIPQYNYFSESLKLPLFDFQLRLKNRTFSFSVNENQSIRCGFENNLIRFINEGNYPWLGSTFSTNFDFNFLHYREYSLGYSQPIIKNLTIGSRVKLLTGFSTFDVQQMNIGFETGSNMEFLKFHATGSYNVCLPFSLNVAESDSSANETFTMGQYLTSFDNLGVAFDLGVKYQILPSLEVSASVIDLGFINWKNNAEKLSHSGSFNWQGFNLSNITNQSGYNEAPYLSPLQSMMDSLDGLLNFNVEQTSFNSAVPTKIFIAANYQVSNFFNAGIVDRILIYDNQVSNAFTLSGNLCLGAIFSLSAGYSIIDNSFDNLSLGTALKLGPIQFYCLTDNILALNVLNTQNFNFRFGMNFMFGKIKSDKL